MKNKILALFLLVGLLIPSSSALADSNKYTGEGFGKGDSGYEDGMYLPEMSVLGLYHFENGEIINPYGPSKAVSYTHLTLPTTF